MDQQLNTTSRRNRIRVPLSFTRVYQLCPAEWLVFLFRCTGNEGGIASHFDPSLTGMGFFVPVKYAFEAHVLGVRARHG